MNTRPTGDRSVEAHASLDKSRLPASYFVSISYRCWAYRRQGVTLDAEGKIGKWLY